MTVQSWRQQYESPDGIQSPRKAVRVLQGLAAEIPVLTVGEVYFATDTGKLSVGPTPNVLASESFVTTAVTSAVATETARAEAAEALLAPTANPIFTGVATAPTLVESATLSPTSAGSAGTTGQIAWDVSKIYICTAGGIAGSATWKAATLTAV